MSGPTSDPGSAAAAPEPTPTPTPTAATAAYEVLAQDRRPNTDAVLTVRVVKSFEFRTFKAMVLRGIDLERVTVGELMERCRADIKTTPGFKAYRLLELDTLKLYTNAHGHKTTNLIINLDHDEWILSGEPDKTLVEIGARNETELSLFNRAAYEAFKLNPEIKWD